MVKETLVVVHGMGEHTAESVKDEVVECFKNAFELYPDSLKGTEPDDHFKIVCYGYNSLFEAFKQKLPTDAHALFERLITPGGPPPIDRDLVDAISGIDAKVAGDSFFATHWLDVILYRTTYLSEPIRIGLAKAIMEAGNVNRVHVLGHSLGTAVVHDTLAKMYGAEPIRDGKKILKLSSSQDKLGSVHMVANVSRVLQSFRKAGASEVRPGFGCVGSYFQYLHKLDPVTMIKPFDPLPNGDWLEPSVYKDRYRRIEIGEVTAPNVHALSHYLGNPAVHVPILGILGISFKKGETEKAAKKFAGKTLASLVEPLRQVNERVDTKDESMNGMLKAAMALQAMVNGR